MQTYAYIRVSSNTQSIERQMYEIKKFNVDNKNIFIDKQSGKDFNRTSYQKLRKLIKKNDLLIIKSIDRLGRNYDMIIEEWHYITKIVEADIFVIDMPILDTRVKPDNLVGKFISDIVLQILSFVSENERKNIRQRQIEGIKIAKANGVHLGRPKYKLTDDFYFIANKYLNKELSAQQAINILNMKRSTFYKYINIYKNSL